MAIWVKPNGIELVLNEAEETVKYAKKIGWKRKAAKPKAKPKQA